jgi:hypothetical protein
VGTLSCGFKVEACFFYLVDLKLKRVSLYRESIIKCSVMRVNVNY